MRALQRYREAEVRLFADAGIDPIEHEVALAALGGTARVLEVGDGAPVVFLHGGPMAAATWSYVAGAAEGLRCLLVDRPGCGLSEAPAVPPTAATLRGYTAQLTVDVLDAFGLEAASLVGSSLGGYSALCTAIDHPARVAGVVLAGFPAFVPGWHKPSFFRLLRIPLLWRLVVSAPPTSGSVRMSMRQMGEQRALADSRIPSAMLDWTRAWLRDTDTMQNDARTIRACAFDPSVDLAPSDLGRVTAPCLVIAGTDDPVGDDRLAQSLASHLLQAHVDVWESAGHLPWLGAPQRAADAIGAFVREGAPRA